MSLLFISNSLVIIYILIYLFLSFSPFRSVFLLVLELREVSNIIPPLISTVYSFIYRFQFIIFLFITLTSSFYSYLIIKNKQTEEKQLLVFCLWFCEILIVGIIYFLLLRYDVSSFQAFNDNLFKLVAGLLILFISSITLLFTYNMIIYIADRRHILITSFSSEKLMISMMSIINFILFSVLYIFSIKLYLWIYKIWFLSNAIIFFFILLNSNLYKEVRKEFTKWYEIVNERYNDARSLIIKIPKFVTVEFNIFVFITNFSFSMACLDKFKMLFNLYLINFLP